MKGLNQGGDRANKYFLAPMKGDFVLFSKTPKEGFEEYITPKSGKLKYIRKFSNVTGFIRDLRTRETDYGKRWELELYNEGDTYIVEWNYSCGYSTTFLSQFENIDFSKMVTLSLSVKEVELEGKDAKTISLGSMWVRQDNETVGFKYTKANPNGRPEVEKLKVKGEDVNDDTKRLEFHEAIVADIIKKVKETIVVDSTPDVPHEEGGLISDEAFDDDLPF